MPEKCVTITPPLFPSRGAEGAPGKKMVLFPFDPPLFPPSIIPIGRFQPQPLGIMDGADTGVYQMSAHCGVVLEIGHKVRGLPAR